MRHSIEYRRGRNMGHAPAAHTYRLHITHQSHVYENFGPSSSTWASDPASGFRASNKIILESTVSPCWRAANRVANLWGWDSDLNDEPLVFATEDELREVIAAIEEYNSTDGGFASMSGYIAQLQSTTCCSKCGGTGKIKILMLDRFVEDPCPSCRNQ